MDSDIPKKVMMRVSTFPNMPQAAIKLREVLTQEEVSIDKIEGILRQDPGLATNVLRLANSAFFGLRTKVGSLKHAVMVLGVKRFAKIAFSESMSKIMNKAVEGYNLSSGELWRHSIGVANAAEALAPYTKSDENEDFYTPALIHDMGKLILSNFLKEERKKIESIAINGLPLVRAENMVLGINHAEVGALILTKWSFPSDIVEAVRWHHDPESSKISIRKLDIVYLSNLIYQLHGDSGSADGPFAMTLSKIIDRLGIDLDQYELIAEKIRSNMNRISHTLTFD